MKIMRIGIDLAKTVFQVHGVDAQEKPVCRRQLHLWHRKLMMNTPGKA